jgi:SAM-dependent methyltransferase
LNTISFTRIAQNVARQFGPPISMNRVSRRLLEESNNIYSSSPLSKEDIRNTDIFKEMVSHSISLMLPPTDSHKRFMKEHWAVSSRENHSVNSVFQKALSLSEESGGDLIAVDLGCGGGCLTSELLKRGWKVTALDSSVESVMHLFEHVELSLDANQIDDLLSLRCEDMEGFEFPKDISLITAQNSFSFTDPSRFLGLWNRIHGSLKPGGYVAGNVLVRPYNPRYEALQRKYHVWYADMQMVKALGRGGYKAVHLSQKDSFAREGSPIEFIFQKK